jgi:acyl-CoA thioesterase-1
LASTFSTITFATLALVSPTAAAANPDPTTVSETRSIVVLGDSISASYRIQSEQGWVSLLNLALAQRELGWHAVNASVSGETTGGGLARLPGVLAETNPDIVIIELGGNDGLRGYPINKIRSNLQRMVDLVKAAGATPLVVAMRIPPNYGPRYATAFDDLFKEVADQKNSAFVPFLLEEVALNDELMQDDGIHPTAEAQPLLLNAVWLSLEPLL